MKKYVQYVPLKEGFGRITRILKSGQLYEEDALRSKSNLSPVGDTRRG